MVTFELEVGCEREGLADFDPPLFANPGIRAVNFFNDPKQHLFLVFNVKKCCQHKQGTLHQGLLAKLSPFAVSTFWRLRVKMACHYTLVLICIQLCSKGGPVALFPWTASLSNAGQIS